MRHRRAIELATITALIGAVLMITAEFVDLFVIEGLKGNTIDSSTAGSNHGYALLIIAVTAIGSVFLARASGQWMPAAGAAALGLLALIIVLASDLPDATSSGLTEDRLVGDAHPAAGFWLEFLGAAAVTAACGAIAWVLRDQSDDDDLDEPVEPPDPRRPGARPPEREPTSVN